MVDKTELPKLHPKNSLLSDNVSFESIDENDSDYETPVYPPMRTIDPQAKPKKSTLKQGKFVAPKRPVQFEKEPTFFDCCRNGELDLVKKFISEMQ
jgi:hypothetical protein